ncbi:alpha/beta fold hydrolase [Streptomyces roseochromogenus]|uniref:alpha/beta fold hydrolase n=1 Tax=Streptomyces roseochromogenus TaxID=285450 RepID=UPI003159494A
MHCRGADGADWTAVAARLAAPSRPRPVHAPDLSGHGHSDWPGDCRAEAMGDDIRALPAALGHDSADGVDHSLGGIVACLLAQRHPGVVRRLVLEDGCAPDAQRNAPDPVWWDHMDRITMRRWSSGVVPPASSHRTRSRSPPP